MQAPVSGRTATSSLASEAANSMLPYLAYSTGVPKKHLTTQPYQGSIEAWTYLVEAILDANR